MLINIPRETFRPLYSSSRGLAILSLTAVGPKTLWGLVGLVLLVTGSLGTWPVYTLLRFDTCAMKSGGRAAVPGN
jgi:hypothetical protein